MSSRRLLLARALLAACLLLALISLVFFALNGETAHSDSIGEPAVEAIFGLFYLSFPIVGYLIVTRQPGNAIGWLFLAAGFGAQIDDAALGYATYTILKQPGSLPAGPAAALLADLVWVPSMATGISLLLLLFPTGRPPSPRWNPLVWIIVLGAVVYAVTTLLNPGPLYYFESVDNPLGIEAGSELLNPLVDIVGAPFLLTTLAAVVALVLRFRRSTGIERSQLKWLVYTAVMLVALLPVVITLGEAQVEIAGIRVSDFIYLFFTASIPIAVGAAILRHRLYDIDVVINRTLVYGALTATLAGAYLALVLLLQLVLSPGSDFAIAGSTLAVAALVRPARRRIQELVDRRFYRNRYDATQTVEAFSARVRDQVDLEALGEELRYVAGKTMQPRHVSLWLREAPR